MALIPGSYVPGRLGGQDPVHDRDDVSQALAGPGAGRQHVAAAGACRFDGPPLVLVQLQHWAVRALFFQPEDPLALRMQQPVCHQLRDRLAGGEAGVE
jgi:hypothetical protein